MAKSPGTIPYSVPPDEPAKVYDALGMPILWAPCGRKLWSETMPRTTGASAAGICGSLILATWRVPFTSRL